MKIVSFLFFMFSFLFSDCIEYIDQNTGEYSSLCASQYLDITHQNYNFIMGLLGALTGLVFLSSVIYILFHIGKSYRI